MTYVSCQLDTPFGHSDHSDDVRALQLLISTAVIEMASVCCWLLMFRMAATFWCCRTVGEIEEK